jgi:hypothetical protein
MNLQIPLLLESFIAGCAPEGFLLVVHRFVMQQIGRKFKALLAQVTREVSGL